MRKTTRNLLIALAISLLAHGSFVLSSQWIRVPSYAEAAQRVEELFRIPLQEEGDLFREHRRTLLRPQNVDARAREDFDELAARLPEPPEKPPIVPESILRDEHKGGPEGDPQLRNIGLNTEIPPPDQDLLSDLYASVPQKVIEASRDSGREIIEAEPIRLEGGLGDLEGGGGLVVPSINATAQAFAPAPVAMIEASFPSVHAPRLPTIDLEEVQPLLLPTPPSEVPAKPLPIEEATPAVPVLDPFLNVTVDTYHDPTGQGFFRLSIRPNEKSGELQAIPKDLIFVLDASSSMGKPRFYRLREALKDCIVALNPSDRFNVVGFKKETIFFRRSLVPASKVNIRAALDFVSDLESSGRTDIYRSLATTLTKRPARERPFLVFLFSDGVPTAGRTDARQIIIDLTFQNQGGATIFSFGTATDPRHLNKYFLDMLSYLNRGFVDFRYSDDAITRAVRAMYQQIDDPLLIDIRGDYGAIQRDQIYPAVLPDLYRDGVINIYGKYSSETEFYFRLEGTGPEGQIKDFVYRQDFPSEDTGSPDIARQWAFQKIYSVIGEMCLAGESPQGLELVRSLGEKYSIQSPYYHRDR